MKVRIYYNDTDTSVFAIWDDSGKRTKEINTFVFNEFTNKLHSYFVKRWNWVKLILATKAIILHQRIVPTVMDMTTDGDDDITIENIKLPPMDTDVQRANLMSPDGNIYIVVMDEEMGRGWAVFIVIKPDGNKEILQEGHRDNVLDWFVEGAFIKSFGIDYESKELADLNNIPEHANQA